RLRTCAVARAAGVVRRRGRPARSRDQELDDEGRAADAQAVVVVELPLLALLHPLLVDEGAVARAVVLDEGLTRGRVGDDRGVPRRGAGVIDRDVDPRVGAGPS